MNIWLVELLRKEGWLIYLLIWLGWGFGLEVDGVDCDGDESGDENCEFHCVCVVFLSEIY